MSFLYAFLTFLQPGILWPELADLRPMQLAAAIGLLFAVSRRADYPRRNAFTHPVFVWFVIFLLMQVFSVYYGGVVTVVDEFAFWSVYLLFMLVSILLITDAIALQRYVWGMLIGGLFVVGYGLYVVFVEGGFEESGRAGAYGMYENHNDYTFIIIQIVPFLFTYMVAERGVIRRVFLAAGLAACVVAIFMSLSRGGILALVIEAALIVLLAMKGKWRFLLMPFLAVAAAISITYLWAARAENQPGEYDAQAAQSSRFEFWEAGLEMLEKHPFLGVGSRRFAEYSADYGQVTHHRIGRNSHNTYIEILAGTGILGFLPFLAFVYLTIRELSRKVSENAPRLLDATRAAALISFCAILFRAFLDAKMYDWSFYVLCVICVACAVLRKMYADHVSPTAIADASLANEVHPISAVSNRAYH
jgi:O-antigen ligase